MIHLKVKIITWSKCLQIKCWFENLYVLFYLVVAFSTIVAKWRDKSVRVFFWEMNSRKKIYGLLWVSLILDKGTFWTVLKKTIFDSFVNDLEACNPFRGQFYNFLTTTFWIVPQLLDKRKKWAHQFQYFILLLGDHIHGN